VSKTDQLSDKQCSCPWAHNNYCPSLFTDIIGLSST